MNSITDLLDLEDSDINISDIIVEGQTKTKLGNPEVKGWVDSMVYEQLNQFFGEKKNKDLGTMIFKIIIYSSSYLLI